MEGITAPPEWREVLSHIGVEREIILIIGASDTGKTTLAKFLIGNWCTQGHRVAFVDGDVGQSTIGLPATTALAIFDYPPSEWEKINPISLRFVGSVTPAGYTLPIITGLKKLVDKALQQRAQIVLIDTTGLVYGEIAVELKLKKIDLLNPTHVLALQRSQEIEPLLQRLQRMGKPRIHRLPVSVKAKARSQSKRRSYRKARFQKYFEGAEIKEIPLNTVFLRRSWRPARPGNTGEKLDAEHLSKVLQTEVIYGEKCQDELFLLLKKDFNRRALTSLQEQFHVAKFSVCKINDLYNLIVGLNNSDGWTMALGILIDVECTQKKLLVRTPLKDNLGSVKDIQFGSVKFEN